VVESLPPHLLILGAGYVALELAQAMRRLGSRATMIEREQRFLAREDENVAIALKGVLEAEGIEIMMGAEVRRISGRSGTKVTLEAVVDEKPPHFNFPHPLG
jgi:pyruvate/2-oxoglutarate dehydrogenase complex dihydrolipoamide dehydrogenase (E3) component